jgi:hypothetical protein
MTGGYGIYSEKNNLRNMIEIIFTILKIIDLIFY